jgi:hypothetical protein
MEKIVNYNTKEINDMGKYLKDAFGAEEFFIDDVCFFESRKDLWLQAI